MNGLLPDKPSIVKAGLLCVVLGLKFQLLGHLIWGSSDIPLLVSIFMGLVVVLSAWYILAVFIKRYGLPKVLILLGLLAVATIAETLLKINQNPITIPVLILFWIGVAYLVFPRFFKKNKIGILGVYGLLIAYYLYLFYTTPNFGVNDRAYFANFMVLPLPFFAVFLIYHQWREYEGLKTERSEAELAMLKSQINPHFFFNTLNNLYGLVVEQSPQAPEVVLKLSEMMRYTIYEGKKVTVKLSDEVNYLESYIELHQLRYQKQVDIQFPKKIEKEVMVAPLLFIILLENAFKHGVESLTEDAYIHLQLRADSCAVHFQVENNFDPEKPMEKGGIGLENLKKRLEHHYPGKHELSLQQLPGKYRAVLKIELNQTAKP